jgi:hypothetical protein
MTDADETAPASGARRILGFGALACAACCIGPIVGVLGAIGIATVAGAVAFGVVGLTIALLAIPVLRTRRRRTTCSTPAASVAVPTPTVRRPR